MRKRLLIVVCLGFVAMASIAQEAQEVNPAPAALRLPEMKVGSHSPAGGPWFNTSWSHTTGYVKLITPIVHNESNMFTIKIAAYFYSPTADSVDIRCSGYAYSASTLVNESCHVEGTDLPVEIGTETRPGGTAPVVVVRIGAPATVWYYAHFTADYIGWNTKAQNDFQWTAGETTPAMVRNTNSILANDRAGTLTVGAPGVPTTTTRLTVNGGSSMAGHVGIGTVPHAGHPLHVRGSTDNASFPGNPFTVLISSPYSYSAANNGAGIGFLADHNAAGENTVIGVVSAVKESTVAGNVAGALTFGTRAAGSQAGSMERMRIKSTGEVVIGQPGNTTTVLTVNGVASASNAYLSNATVQNALNIVGHGGLQMVGGPQTNNVYGWGLDTAQDILSPVGRRPYVLQYHTGLNFAAHSSYGGIRFFNQAYPSPYNSQLVMSMTNGNVGIGTANPSTKLHVEGDVLVSGNIAAKYQDVAEWVPVATEVSAGTVVVLNRAVRNEVMPSSTAYDTKVAGVVSERPGLILGEAGKDKAMIATTGRVKVRVDATKRPVEIGDLLVTSDKPGIAMVSTPVDIGGIQLHRPGTIIGKALEPLPGGEGEVLVLLSLQ